jgi:hypothetical protein
MPLYAQFGCGLSAPPSWRNFDCSPSLRLQRVPLVGRLFRRAPYPAWPAHVEYGDIVVGLPLSARSVEGMYCSHVLEHLALEDFRVALRRVRVYLRDGGAFRLVVPDLERIAAEYLRDRRGAHWFLHEAHLGQPTRARGPAQFVRAWLGNSAHLWMWDYGQLAEELEHAGFTEIRRAEFGDSADPRFAEVEEKSRWIGCLGIECRSEN